MSKIIGFAAFLLVAASSAVGCAASDGAAQDTNGTEASEADLTGAKWLDCTDGFSDTPDSMAHLEVGLSASKITVTDLSKDAEPPTSGAIDPSYHPTSSTYANAIRYGGFEELVDAWDEVSNVDFIISKEVQDGKQGKIWMRTSGGSGGGTESFWCKPKAAAIKVKTSVKSRLACEFGLICTDDNPPGSTCLANGFIQQTADKTVKMRVEYYDHYGVNIVKRKVELGSADSLARDAKSIKGNVDGNLVDLTYRGGVTYTGEFTLADGRKTKATCNDLAMFD